MGRDNVILAIVILSILLCPSLLLSTNISGDIWGVMNPENNPYNVVGDLRVPRDSTLSIQPRCLIYFTGHYKFIIDTNAVFIAEGSETDSIRFTAQDTAEGWLGLRFFNADSSCRLVYCVLECGKTLDRTYQFLNDGGAIYAANTNLQIDHCSLTRNRAWDGNGGAIYFENGRLSLLNSEITHNFCAFGGSGIFCFSSILSIRDCLFYKDSTWYPLGGDFGGAITLSACPQIEIIESTIKDNFSGQGGGGAYITSSSMILDNNKILYNGSIDAGGGVLMVGCTADISRNIIYGNRNYIGGGGGLACVRSTINLCNNTIANNSDGPGGGMWTRLGQTTMRNNIFWGNISHLGMQIYAEQETIAVAEYNDIQGGWPGVGNIDADPLFADTANGDFHLTWTGYPANDSSKSPCIDTGDPSSPLDPDTTRADIGALFFDRRLMAIAEPQPLSEGSWRPDIFSLRNYPNPFNSSTVLRYALPAPSPVTIDIYDILGRKLLTLADGIQPAGSHQLLWDASEVPSGVYFYRLQAGQVSQTRRMMLIK